jgi:hypothetical protein
VPAACQSCNSGDSIISSSSGRILSATSGTSAASSGDENDESRSRSFNKIQTQIYNFDMRVEINSLIRE